MFRYFKNKKFPDLSKGHNYGTFDDENSSQPLLRPPSSPQASKADMYQQQKTTTNKAVYKRKFSEPANVRYRCYSGPNENSAFVSHGSASPTFERNVHQQLLQENTDLRKTIQLYQMHTQEFQERVTGQENDILLLRNRLSRENRRRKHAEELLAKKIELSSNSEDSAPGDVTDDTWEDGVALQEVISKFQLEIQRRIKLQMRIDARDVIIEKLRYHSLMARQRSIEERKSNEPHEGWLAVSSGTRLHWKNRYTVLGNKKMVFYEGSTQFIGHDPCLVLHLNKVIAVRSIVDEMEHVSSAASSVFQVLYSNEGELADVDVTCDDNEILNAYENESKQVSVVQIGYEDKMIKRMSLRAASTRDKQLWMRKLKVKLQKCPFLGDAQLIRKVLENSIEISDTTF